MQLLINTLLNTSKLPFQFENCQLLNCELLRSRDAKQKLQSKLQLLEATLIQASLAAIDYLYL